jgi:hypothetical protein
VDLALAASFFFLLFHADSCKIHRNFCRSPKIVKLDLFDSSMIDLLREIKFGHVKALYT